MRPSRLRHKLIAFLATLLCTACADFVTSSGPALPDSELAILKCYTRYYLVYIDECHVAAVDAQQPATSQLFSKTAKVAPGRRRIVFDIEQTVGGGKGGGGPTYRCEFEDDFRAGHQYAIRAHSLQSEVPWLARRDQTPFKGTIEIGETTAAGDLPAHRVDVVCRFGG